MPINIALDSRYFESVDAAPCWPGPPIAKGVNSIAKSLGNVADTAVFGASAAAADHLQLIAFSLTLPEPPALPTANLHSQPWQLNDRRFSAFAVQIRLSAAVRTN